MISLLPYLIAAGVGVAIAHFISRAPELRSMRLSQFVFVPAAMVVGVYFLPDTEGSQAAEMGKLTCFLAVLIFLVLLLAPNIAYHFGAGLSNFLDSYDWTPTEEEIALRPIRLLIDKDSYRQALAELDGLLEKHKPTYEAVLIKAKLLHHIGRVDETVATLPALIALSQSTAQQLAVMELLDFLEAAHPDPPKPPAPGARRVEIDHELVLFALSGEGVTPHKVIPPGTYEIEETIHRNRRWLKLAGDDWGNAEMWWEALLSIHSPPGAPPKKGLLWQIARTHQAITHAIKGKPRRQLQAESQKLFHEAKEFIRRDDWQGALPLLQKASACDPDRYEIAYRWMLAVRQTSNDDATARAVSQVLRQSQWSQDEQDMLNQLKRPIAR